MEELLLAIANSSIEQQVSLLPQALEYGESGIDFQAIATKHICCLSF